MDNCQIDYNLVRKMQFLTNTKIFFLGSKNFHHLLAFLLLLHTPLFHQTLIRMEIFIVNPIPHDDSTASEKTLGLCQFANFFCNPQHLWFFPFSSSHCTQPPLYFAFIHPYHI